MNPRAGARSRHQHVLAIQEALERRGFRVAVTTDLTALRQMTAEDQKTGDLRAVLAIGGDGTASVVRNYVPLEVPLVNVPMGTENLLGRFLGQFTSPEAVCSTIEEGVVLPLDLGRVGDKVFLLMISVGFDAEVIRSLHENRRGNIRRTAYFMPTLQAIRGYTYPPMQVYFERGDGSSPPPHLCRWLFGFNLPLYALGLPIAPDAVATDGLLDVCMFERGAMWSIARYLWHVVQKSHHTLPDASLCRSHRFRIEPTTTASIAYQLDGDYGGTLPIVVDVLPGELKVLAPRETAQRLGFHLPASAIGTR
jgi:diacylglycerol kinase family enzyme